MNWTRMGGRKSYNIDDSDRMVLSSDSDCMNK